VATLFFIFKIIKGENLFDRLQRLPYIVGVIAKHYLLRKNDSVKCDNLLAKEPQRTFVLLGLSFSTSQAGSGPELRWPKIIN